MALKRRLRKTILEELGKDYPAIPEDAKLMMRRVMEYPNLQVVGIVNILHGRKVDDEVIMDFLANVLISYREGKKK